jgi:hypothetical protein
MEFETFVEIEYVDADTLTRFGFCAGCAAETVFCQPPCLDGHGVLCPEWVCTDCGLAVSVPIGEHLEPVPVTQPDDGRVGATVNAA